jgi:hypothetical protein
MRNASCSEVVFPVNNWLHFPEGASKSNSKLVQ